MKLIKNFINGVANFIRKHFVISLIIHIFLLLASLFMGIYHEEFVITKIPIGFVLLGFMYLVSNRIGIYILTRRIAQKSFLAYERNEKYERIQGVITAICFLISSTLFLACAITIGIYEIVVMN